MYMYMCLCMIYNNTLTHILTTQPYYPLSLSVATFENTNTQRVLDEHKKQKDSSKSQHDARVARDKAALTADRDSKAKRKEERKKQTQKQERRA